MKFAVVVFPGSNCDHDAYHAVTHVLGQDAEFVCHKETSLAGADAAVELVMAGQVHAVFARDLADLAPDLGGVLEAVVCHPDVVEES